jgi:hypothetical protein
MRTLVLRGLWVSLSLATAGLQAGFDFTAADALFADRGKGPAEATEAWSAYRVAVKQSVEEEDRVYAVTQVGRLSLLLGSLMENNVIPVEKRRDILETCIDATKTIESTKRQEYYYVALSCIGVRGKIASNLIDKFIYARKVSAIQDAALASLKGKDAFEAGGIYRVLAAIRGNPQAKIVGLYNPEEGLAFAQAAIATQAKVYRPFTEPLSGETYWDNYLYLGQAFIALGVDKKDKTIVQQGQQKLLGTLSLLQEYEDDGVLSSERAPEVNAYRELMNKLAKVVGNCLVKSEWGSCITDAME